MPPRSVQTPVRLNVYDLTDSNDYTVALGLGVFHSGVEIGGDEFSFASGAGVFASTPRQVPGAKFRESIEMGMFQGSYTEARTIAHSLSPDFDGASYNLLTKNCNTYADALCLVLVGKPIPAYINRAAYLGSFFSCLMPDTATTQAPVGDPRAIGPSSTSTQYAPFSGSGMAASSGSSTAPGNATLSDRRERVRQAALRRMQLDGDTTVASS